MNVETANRLQMLRKKNGYSQETLAEKIGVSRQAVSKWERAEASPDTDNLILLSKLYGITIDELLKTDSIPMPNDPDNNVISLRKDDYVQDDDDGEIYPERRFDTVCSEPQGAPCGNLSVSESVKDEEPNGDARSFKAKAAEIFLKAESKESDGKTKEPAPLLDKLFPLIIVCVFIFSIWLHSADIGWIVFFLIPLYYIWVNAYRKYRRGEKTFAQMIISFVDRSLPLDVTILFLISGMFFGYWEYLWTIFFIIPLYYTGKQAIVKRNLLIFCYPVAAVWAFFSLTYLFDARFGLVSLMTIPFYYIIADHFRKKSKNKKQN